MAIFSKLYDHFTCLPQLQDASVRSDRERRVWGQGEVESPGALGWSSASDHSTAESGEFGVGEVEADSAGAAQSGGREDDLAA